MRRSKTRPGSNTMVRMIRRSRYGGCLWSRMGAREGECKSDPSSHISLAQLSHSRPKFALMRPRSLLCYVEHCRSWLAQESVGNCREGRNILWNDGAAFRVLIIIILRYEIKRGPRAIQFHQSLLERHICLYTVILGSTTFSLHQKRVKDGNTICYKYCQFQQ